MGLILVNSSEAAAAVVTPRSGDPELPASATTNPAAMTTPIVAGVMPPLTTRCHVLSQNRSDMRNTAKHEMAEARISRTRSRLKSRSRRPAIR